MKLIDSLYLRVLTRRKANYMRINNFIEWDLGLELHNTCDFDNSTEIMSDEIEERIRKDLKRGLSEIG